MSDKSPAAGCKPNYPHQAKHFDETPKGATVEDVAKNGANAHKDVKESIEVIIKPQWSIGNCA
jgi:hypothetical protein